MDPESVRKDIAALLNRIVEWTLMSSPELVQEGQSLATVFVKTTWTGPSKLIARLAAVMGQPERLLELLADEAKSTGERLSSLESDLAKDDALKSMLGMSVEEMEKNVESLK